MWNNTKKAAIATKQQVAPLQANEVANIRKRAAAFDVRQHEHREEFRKIQPMLYACSNPYELIDAVNCSDLSRRRSSKLVAAAKLKIFVSCVHRVS